MKSKLFKVKNSLAAKIEKLNEEELSYVTGGAAVDAGGSSGTGSGPTCDNTRVHCCIPKLILADCH